jgi:hypothetical protein
MPGTNRLNRLRFWRTNRRRRFSQLTYPVTGPLPFRHSRDPGRLGDLPGAVPHLQPASEAGAGSGTLARVFGDMGNATPLRLSTYVVVPEYSTITTASRTCTTEFGVWTSKMCGLRVSVASYVSVSGTPSR